MSWLVKIHTYYIARGFSIFIALVIFICLVVCVCFFLGGGGRGGRGLIIFSVSFLNIFLAACISCKSLQLVLGRDH